ncbi:MAG: cytochrome c [Flammeovirgaceae bacterium]|nr:MAG: cytochrome c [Flammeovirgaceae bacterium]
MERNYWLLLTSLLFVGCGHSQEKNKFTNYYRQGEQLYIKHCSNCHQPNGTGLGRVYPPLHQSDYMKNNFKAVICLMKNGIDGPLLVNGKEFNQAMPGVPTLTDLEIAEIATYIYNSWEHKRGLVDVAEVSNVLRECTSTLN